MSPRTPAVPDPVPDDDPPPRRLKAFGDMARFEARLAPPSAARPAPAAPRTPARRRRDRRDLVIYVAHRKGGLSQRLLADVFGLARSRVGTIVAGIDRELGRP